ncbi:MAG: NGG1p interacting factor NIF3 [Candidatus Omnitrophota bacterium]
MKLSDFYASLVKAGSDLDPRCRKISSYADTAILYGSADTQVNKILVGIDIEVGELLLADKIRRESSLDLVLSHHPEGKAWAALYDVMQLQVDLLIKAGVSRRAAEGMLVERKREVERKLLPNNHTRAVDAARLLDLPFACCHTPADNHASFFIEKLMRDARPKKVADIVDILLAEPEYKHAQEQSAGPKVILGNPKRAVGKVFVEMTGGTEGPKEAFDSLYKNGVRTIVSMHLSEEHFRKIKDGDLNVVIAGHISSDTLGLNLILDKLEKKEKFSIISCSGFTRFSRN